MGKKYDGSLVFDTHIDTKEFENGIGKLKSIAKTGAVAIGAASAAIGAVGAAAIKAYADYEQLVGGVDTLFKDSSKTIQKYADEAYKAAGMSANKYMETVTSFSASLLQSLGGDTAKSAEYANQAVIDMSDNANKMGTNIQSIQDAYQGFAKQNYTMLDNLKLGYGGTKEEMQRLLQDAEKLSGIKYDISSFADITQAIHVIQTEMGITGTTAEEAATTIQGSLGMVKASWENLMTGLADPNADLDSLMSNFADSISTFGENLIPVIAQIAEQLPGVIETLGTHLINGIPGVVNNMLPQIADMALQLITALSTSLSNNAPMIGDCAVNIFTTLIDAILQNLPIISQTGITLISTLAQGLAQAVPNLIPAIIKSLLAMVDTLLNNIDMMIDTAIELVMAFADGITAALPNLIEMMPEIIIKLVAALVRNYPKMAVAGRDMIGKFFEACLAVFITSWSTLGTYIDKYVVQPVKNTVSDMVSVGKNIVEGLWNGITNKGEWLLSKIKSFAHTVTQGIKDFFGIKSPSRVMRDEVGKMLVAGMGVGITENEKLAITAMENACVKLEKVSEDAAKNAEEFEKKRRERELKNLKNSLDLGLITEQEYYEKLKDYRDKYFEQGTDSWYSYTEEIAKYNKKMSDNAVEEQKKMVEKIIELRDELADKLRTDNDSLLETTQTTIHGSIFGEDGSGSYTSYSLADLEKENSRLEHYRDVILKLKDLGNVPAGIFTKLRDMSVEDGTRLAETILNAEEEARSKFLNDYRSRDDLSDDIATQLSPILDAEKFEEEGIVAAQSFTDGYSKKLEEDKAAFIKILENRFGTLPDFYYNLGTDSADEFDKGFFEKIPKIVERFKQLFISEINSIAATISSGTAGKIRVSAAGGGNTYHTNTFTFNAAKQTVTEQLNEAKRAATLAKMRGN